MLSWLGYALQPWYDASLQTLAQIWLVLLLLLILGINASSSVSSTSVVAHYILPWPQDLTDPERRYIYNKMGPENRKFAKWAREMADQLGPVSGGEVHHDCDCMEYTCFCGKVKDLAEAQRAAYGSPSEDSTDNSESEWTDCSESELADMMKHASDCSDASCDCASGATQGQIVPKDVFL